MWSDRFKTIDLNWIKINAPADRVSSRWTATCLQLLSCTQKVSCLLGWMRHIDVNSSFTSPTGMADIPEKAVLILKSISWSTCTSDTSIFNLFLSDTFYLAKFICVTKKKKHVYFLLSVQIHDVSNQSGWMLDCRCWEQTERKNPAVLRWKQDV